MQTLDQSVRQMVKNASALTADGDLRGIVAVQRPPLAGVRAANVLLNIAN